MLVSQKWLSEYVEVPEHDTLVDRLTMSGLNHEGTISVGQDQQIDLEVTSNRSDCLGHIGVAREISVLFENPLSIPDPQPAEAGSPIRDEFQVEIEATDLCHRFTARLIRGVKIGPSPDWLAERLQSVGVASVNNVVDISNYVMLECGQPLHTFDYAKLTGQKIVVRQPLPGEKLQAIDHHTYDLEPGMCVIADAERAVGLAGVMGGAETEVSDQTTDILIEAAFFEPMCVRSTARKLKLHSAASYRFERSINEQNLDWASRRCCQLILEIAGGQLAPGMIDVGRPPADDPKLTLRFAQLQRILGITIPGDTATRILDELGFQPTSANEESVTVIAPAWRTDCTREVDLIEEVGRIYGYDKVPDDIDVPMAASVKSHGQRVVEKIRTAMICNGFDEAMTASLVPRVWSESFSPWSDNEPLQSLQPMLGVLDTSWQNTPVNILRRSLVPSLLEAYRVNEYKLNDQVNLFEIARVYLPNGQAMPTESTKLAMVSEEDYAGVKGVIESILDLLEPGLVLGSAPCDLELLDITRSAELRVGDQRLGWIGQVSDNARNLFRFKKECTIAEVDLAVLENVARTIAHHQPLSQFPAINRDFNFVVHESTSWDQLSDCVRRAGGSLMESIDYKETFRNTEKDGPDKKRVLLSVTLRSGDATLTGEQAETVCQKIVEGCQNELAANLLT